MNKQKMIILFGYDDETSTCVFESVDEMQDWLLDNCLIIDYQSMHIFKAEEIDFDVIVKIQDNKE